MAISLNEWGLWGRQSIDTWAASCMTNAIMMGRMKSFAYKDSFLIGCHCSCQVLRNLLKQTYSKHSAYRFRF